MIVITKTVLVDTGDGGLAQEPGSVTRDAEGRFIVIPAATEGAPAIFAKGGTFLQWLGRTGRGPGEYQMPFHARVDRFDSLHVFDVVSQRRNVYSREVSFAGSRPSPIWINHPSLDLVLLDDGTAVANATINTSDRIGYPLHFVTPAGQLGRSFGVDVPFYRPDLRFLNERILAPAADGGFWAAHTTSYRIERWDTSGKKTFDIARNSEWFKPNGYYGPIQAKVPPGSRVTGVREDPNGLIWTALLVADARWASALGPIRVDSTRANYAYHESLDPTRYYDTIIEVFDPKRGVVLARTRVDAPLGTRVDDRKGQGLAMAGRIAEQGGDDLALEVWQFVLSPAG